MSEPLRIQRQRTKGWKMPDGAVYVGRPTLWGNPVVVNDKCSRATAVKMYRRMLTTSQTRLVGMLVYEDGTIAPLAGIGLTIWRNKVRQSLHDLRGKDLACWCRLDQPCHADVLLELANK